MYKSIMYQSKKEKYSKYEFHKSRIRHLRHPADSDCNAVAEKLAVNLHEPDGIFLFQDAQTVATRPKRKVSSRASGSGRAITRWRTNSPGARG